MGGIKKEESQTVKKTTAKSSSVKTKSVTKKAKPTAGIDENGTFRAWDNAKTVAKTKKAAAPQSSVEERAADKKATAEAEKK